MSGECDVLSKIKIGEKGEERDNRWRSGIVDMKIEIASDDEVRGGKGKFFKESRKLITKNCFREMRRTVNSEESVSGRGKRNTDTE